MRTTITILLITFLSGVIYAQNTLNVKNIPDSLTKHADAVIRFSDTKYIRTSTNTYKVEYHYAVTILNKSAKSKGNLQIPYDKNSSVSNIKGFVYDKNGVKSDKLKKSDILDIIKFSDYTFFSDQRIKVFNPSVNDYPFTVEYSYTITHKALVGFPGWLPINDFNVSVQEANLEFTTPADLDINFKTLNSPTQADVNIEQGNKHYSWNVKNLRPIEYESFSPSYDKIFPTILLAPKEFSYEKTEGTYDSWESYGNWGFNLINERDDLSEETKNYLISLTDTLKTRKEKISAIYKYMQGRTRYVNIHLGIGGFQPMLASEVDAKGFGDCKGLSNYTKALLKSIGIKSFYTEIGAGKHQQIRYLDFPSSYQTNHIILCVPDDNDTIWLECTNQKKPFNYLGGGTIDRYALLITNEGGKIVRTPTFTADENNRVSNINFNIHPEGSSDFELHTIYENIMYDEIEGLLYTSNKEQEEALLKGLNANGMKINSFSFSDESEDYAKAVLNVEGSLSQFATSAGKRMIFTPTYFLWNSFLNYIPKDRKFPLYHPQGFTYTDSLNIIIPAGYSIEYLPEDLNLKTTYGTCMFSFKETGKGIAIVRKIRINKGTYNKEMFKDIDDFLSHIDDREDEKVVLISK